MSQDPWSWLGKAAASELPRMIRRWRTPREYHDTLRRLLTGDFHDLDEAARTEKVEQIIRASASAAMALGAAPVPFLELPVQAAMVQAIGRVHGVRGSRRRIWLSLVAAMGGGMAMGQALRLVPWGNLTRISRVYGATWALGHAADLYFRRELAPTEKSLREVFQETFRAKTQEQRDKLAESDLAVRLRRLHELWKEGLLSEEEYRDQRTRLLAEL